ncbi:MAG: peroxiredoxin [Nitrospirota bacterium]
MCENIEERRVKIGEKVPDFELDTFFTDKKDFGKIKLSDLSNRGYWTILFFYPADYTFVCPTELADLQGQYDSIKKEGAEVVAISTDTHFVHLAWQTSEKLISDIRYPMGADPTHAVSKIFGVYDEATGLSLRGTFIIDPDGTLAASEINNFPVGRNADELLRKLKAFKYVKENPAEVCPAKWETGKKTLSPGKDLVGKVGDELG